MDDLYSSDGSGAESGDNVQNGQRTLVDYDGSDREDSAHDSEEDNKTSTHGSDRENSGEESDAERQQNSSDDEGENQSEHQKSSDDERGNQSERQKSSDDEQENQSGSEAEGSSNGNASDAGSNEDEEKNVVSDVEHTPKESDQEEHSQHERASSVEHDRSSGQEDSAHGSEEEDRKSPSQKSDNENSAEESDAENSDEEVEQQKRRSDSASDSDHKVKKMKRSVIQDESGSEAEVASNGNASDVDDENQNVDVKASDDETSPKDSGDEDNAQQDLQDRSSDKEDSAHESGEEEKSIAADKSDRENSGEESDVGRSRKSSESDARENQSDSDVEIKVRKRRQVNEEESDSDVEQPAKKVKRSVLDDELGSDAENTRNENGSEIGSDNEKRKDSEVNVSEEGGSPKATAHDLFGDDVDISSEDEAGNKATENTDTVPNGDVEMQSPTEAQDEPPLETRIEVEIPRICTNLGKEIHFIKLPNFLSVDTRPYDPQWYEDEIDEDEVLDEEGRARLKLKVENTIRWRKVYDDDGNPVNESNARVIKWSDGSLSLHLGSEIFDVYRQTLMPGDHNHLFIRQGTGLQGQAVFRTKLTFRPHSTDSFTHRKMTLSLADRNQKTQKIRVLPNVGKDPEAHRSEMIKQEEDRLKASIRRESKQRRMKEKSHSRGLSTSYLEPDRYEEDDDGAISLSAIKNKYKKGGSALKERQIYSSDEVSDEDSKAKRLEQAKEDDNDSDLDYFDRKKAANDGKKKTIQIEESDEDDD